jgi:hypothetical protein
LLHDLGFFFSKLLAGNYKNTIKDKIEKARSI